jgi:hypothetical protein
MDEEEEPIDQRGARLWGGHLQATAALSVGRDGVGFCAAASCLRVLTL